MLSLGGLLLMGVGFYLMAQKNPFGPLIAIIGIGMIGVFYT